MALPGHRQRHFIFSVKKLIIATRKSPLALAQTGMAAEHLRRSLKVETELLKIVTTGDRQAEWSLEQQGGKGLFTSELEQALLRGEADVAIHSTKDLPGEMPAGLAVAGCAVMTPRRGIVNRSTPSKPKRRKANTASRTSSVRWRCPT